ncbi:Protein of unknown function [Bacillus wiedmannii]|nr:Protein of unknown function [Bacillus wiedmannii]
MLKTRNIRIRIVGEFEKEKHNDELDGIWKSLPSKC